MLSWVIDRAGPHGHSALSASVLLAHAAREHVNKPVPQLLFCIGFTVLGSLMVFNLFGFASLFRNDRRQITSWGRWTREHWDLPAPTKLVGWIYLVVGAPSTIWFLIKVL